MTMLQAQEVFMKSINNIINHGLSSSLWLLIGPLRIICWTKGLLWLWVWFSICLDANWNRWWFNLRGTKIVWIIPKRIHLLTKGNIWPFMVMNRCLSILANVDFDHCIVESWKLKVESWNSCPGCVLCFSKKKRSCV